MILSDALLVDPTWSKQVKFKISMDVSGTQMLETMIVNLFHTVKSSCAVIESWNGAGCKGP